MAYNEEYVLSECPRVKRGLTVCKKLKQVRHECNEVLYL